MPRGHRPVPSPVGSGTEAPDPIRAGLDFSPRGTRTRLSSRSAIRRNPEPRWTIPVLHGDRGRPRIRSSRAAGPSTRQCPVRIPEPANGRPSVGGRSGLRPSGCRRSSKQMGLRRDPALRRWLRPATRFPVPPADISEGHERILRGAVSGCRHRSDEIRARGLERRGPWTRRPTLCRDRRAAVSPTTRRPLRPPARSPAISSADTMNRHGGLFDSRTAFLSSTCSLCESTHIDPPSFSNNTADASAK